VKYAKIALKILFVKGGDIINEKGQIHLQIFNPASTILQIKYVGI